MIKPTLQFLTAGSLNYLLVIFSKDIDVEQLLKDFDSIGFVIESNSGFISLFISEANQVSILLSMVILLSIYVLSTIAVLHGQSIHT